MHVRVCTCMCQSSIYVYPVCPETLDAQSAWHARCVCVGGGVYVCVCVVCVCVCACVHVRRSLFKVHMLTAEFLQSNQIAEQLICEYQI